jgi:RND family efflux transporter MFP subunit
MKRRWLALASIGAAMIVAGSGCKHDDAAASASKGAGGGGRGAAGKGNVQFAVDVMPVPSLKVDYIVSAPGTIDAFERVQVTARVSGVIDKVGFTEGQDVKKGDVLVVIESERYQLAVNSAKALVAKAQATQKDMEGAAARRQTATSDHPGLIPGEEVESYKTKALTAQADTASAQESLKVAQANLRDAFVRAPIDGTIQTRTVETGQYVQPGYLMATLLRSDPMLLHFQVQPQDAPRLKPGMTVNFTMRETPNTYSAKITLVAGAAEAATHTVGVTAEVPNTEKKYWLRPGSFCDVTIDVGATRDAPVIPRTATRATDHGYVVYVVDGDVATEKVVTLGMNTKDGRIEVRSGLSAGELLVVRGAEALKSGAHVRASRVESVDGGLSDPIPMALDGGAGEGGRRGAGARPAGSGAGQRRGPKPAGSAAP